MAAFNGYLIKFIKTGKIFPLEIMKYDSYKATPLQRTEIKAIRDNNNLLHRTTSPNFKTKITFDILPISLSEMTDLRNMLNAAFDNAQQRKMRISYWDDELLKYRTMTAYFPDFTYPIKQISSKNIKYKEITFTFIEY